MKILILCTGNLTLLKVNLKGCVMKSRMNLLNFYITEIKKQELPKFACNR